ncbi:H-NS histone family protein [Limnobacter humi]|uniref:H-NS histone family protein n=1 Tax=Limnobacter humi TaxID=1778671 RepID=A0ABT1WGT0_9BURK|nr:H-NS histone family protein [Limnobacter humi]MCQ8896732.1 H-NS histone family protein [Limnobacter humi]
MSGYLDLERCFGQLTEYSVDKLIATDVISRKRISWEQLLEERFSLITARANFGKTQELRASTRRLQKNGRHAVFTSLHRLLAESDFEVALEPSDATAYRAWKSDLEAPLFLFVDSIDEAVLGRESGLQSALRRVTQAMGDRLNQVSWVLTSRPATLTPAVLDVIQAELDTNLYLGEAEESVAEDSLEDMPAGDDGFSDLSSLDPVTTIKTKLVSKAQLKLYRLLPLSTKAAKFYLESRHSIADGKALLDAAWRFGLGDLTEGPGSLDILAYVDPVTNPPVDLTSIFETMIAGVQAQQRTDHREKIVGLSCTRSLNDALEKLAGASAICQLPNLELSTDALKLQEGVLSTRPLIGGLLSESELQYLLGSRLFIDSGYHQVKIYPEQLLPYLAAKRLSARVNSPEDARRLVAELSWKSVTGECGVRSAYLAVAGWLATFNVHCRAELLDIDPQAVAFFGDLRNSQFPVADACLAIKLTIERLEKLGDSLGRNHYNLTAENYWQAGKPGVEETLENAYDRLDAHSYKARSALLDIATYSRIDVFRDRILFAYGNDYAQLLNSPSDLVYILSLNREDDFQGLAEAAKLTPKIEQRAFGLVLVGLAWKKFDAETISDLASRQYEHQGGGFNLSWDLTHSIAESASAEQLFALTEKLLSRMVTYYGAKCHAENYRNDDYADVVRDLIALVIKNEELSLERATQLCMKYFEANARLYLGSIDHTELGRALKSSDAVRQNLFRAVIRKSDRTPDGIWSELCSHRLQSFLSEGDAEAVSEAGFSELMTVLRNNVATRKPSSQPAKKNNSRLKLDESSKIALQKEIESISTGTNTGALIWIARWLSQTSQLSHYSDFDFSAFEELAGQELGKAADQGLRSIWRDRPPQYKESEPNSIYLITIAGLQGLHLDLGNGDSLPKLSDSEVKQALNYGHFELNGYPKWFWPLVLSYPSIAIAEFQSCLAKFGSGGKSAEIVEKLIRHIAECPPVVLLGLHDSLWTIARDSSAVSSHTLENILSAIFSNEEIRGSLDQTALESVAAARIVEAFQVQGSSACDSEDDASAVLKPTEADIGRLRSNAVIWGQFWLLNYPSTFRRDFENWRVSHKDSADKFMFEIAAHIGQDRLSRLNTIKHQGNRGLELLSSLYEWVVEVVQESDDIIHDDGLVYQFEPRDNAQRLRDALLPAISNLKSQAAYDALDGLRVKASGTRARYIRHLQFQMREEEAHIAPLKQRHYEKFERDFAPPVSGYTQFAQTIRNDLGTVKRNIECGEFSLRRFFSKVMFNHIKTDTEGLALEEDFQALLGSELNHASGGRYAVTLESILPESTRRDVLCQLGDLRATIELKMSEHWTVPNYLEALEAQLKGQYMKAPNSKIGFFVIVLQRANRTWNYPEGETLDFDGLLKLLEAKASEFRAEDSSLFLQVVGINAVPPSDFRDAKQAKKSTIATAQKYGDGQGKYWSGKGRRPQWLKDALASGKVLSDYELK